MDKQKVNTNEDSGKQIEDRNRESINEVVGAISILVVDGEPGIALLCKRILSRAGYDVTSETDPRVAIEHLQHKHVDLLLIDNRMPEVDGFDVISRAQMVQPDIAVLVMTGFGTVEMAIRALRQGVDGLLLKPFNKSEELLQAVRQALIDNQRKRDKAYIERPADIFISYARTDVDIVGGVYEKLLNKNHRPWMDVYSLKGGENWLRSIYKAIDECQIFLAVLSNNSVSRRGVIQKELKKALDKWEGMLPDDIYLIPIRIDDCPIPDLLKHLQVLDWDNGKGETKLLEAIRVGLARRKAGG